jgi:hypothetical protein
MEFSCPVFRHFDFVRGDDPAFQNHLFFNGVKTGSAVKSLQL